MPELIPSNARLPVVLATHEFAPFRGGVATYVRELASGAARLGEQVEVWTVDYRDRFKEIQADMESRGKRIAHSNSGEVVPVVRLTSNGRLTPAGLGGLAWGFWKSRRQWRKSPVVLMSVGAQAVFFLLSLVPGLVARERMIPVFYGSEILRFSRNRFWRPLARRFYARAASFGVTSRYVEALLRESGLLPVGAVLIPAFCALPVDFVAQADLGTRKPADDGWRVLTVARLHPRKGQLDVARALGRLPADLRARLVYRVVGTGSEDYRRNVEDACRAGGVRVEFAGALDDAALAREYTRADVYAQASRTLARSVEGFGITFLEASCHGCAVAAYLSGGVGEAVSDGETGLLVPEGDEAALAEAIRRLLEDPALRARLGENGRRFARSFRWEDAAAALCGAARRAAARS